MQKEIAWLLKEKYNNVETPEFYKDVRRLKAGEPLDYVIGFTTFLGCKIDLSKKPLIPRPETEYWVEQEMSKFKIQNLKFKILDIFSGSGCIGVALLKNIENSEVVFAEKNKKFVEQIKINCKINNIDKKRHKIIQSDIFSAVKGKYDYIFANPPYIPVTRISKLQKSVLKYEPKTALFGGGDGLFYIKKFLKSAKKFLNPCAKIFMEFDSPQKREVEKIVRACGYQNCEFKRDQYGRWRWVAIY